MMSHIITLKPEMKLGKPRSVVNITITSISDVVSGSNDVIYGHTGGIV